MDGNASGEATREIIEMSQWGAVIPIARDEQAQIYVPVRALCGYLDLAPNKQIERIKEDAILSKRLQRFPIRSTSSGIRGGGTQMTSCIKLNAVGWWLATISLGLSNVRPEFQAGLMDF